MARSSSPPGTHGARSLSTSNVLQANQAASINTNPTRSQTWWRRRRIRPLPPPTSGTADAAARCRLTARRRQRLHRQAVIGHRPEAERVGGALDAQPQLVAGDGVTRGGKHRWDTQLDVAVPSRLRERHLQAVLSRHVTYLDLELAVDG